MQKECTLPDCSKPHYSKGYCKPHYNRNRKYGDPYAGRALYERGESNTGKTCSEEGCTNPAHRKQLCQTHYMRLPEQRARKAAWYLANREECLARALEWQKNHPESRAATHAQRKHNALAGMDEFDKELSRDYREAIKNDPCFYCGKPGEQYDHYVSLINGGTDHWWNLVRACSACNWTKNRRNGDEFQEGQTVPF